MFGWSAEAWTAIANMLLAVGAILTGLLAVRTYRKTKRDEAARWLQGMFQDFYLSGQFGDVRRLLEYDYETAAAPLLERRLTNRDIPSTPEEYRVLEELDTLLNYFEQVLYLQDEDHLSASDVEALFDYWFGIMRAPNRAALRRYADCFGWERLARELYAKPREQAERSQDGEYVAVYGSLMDGQSLPDRPDLDEFLERVGPCKLPGRLFDMGDYPGLLEGEGTVVGELFRFHRPLALPGDRALAAFRVLDEYERFDARNLKDSLYHRKVMRLPDPDIDAWVYLYNHPLRGDEPRIESGDWRQYVSDRQATSSR